MFEGGGEWVNGICRISCGPHQSQPIDYSLVLILTSSSTPDSTPDSVNRSSHVLMTRGAEDGSRRLTPDTLPQMSDIIVRLSAVGKAYLSRSI